MVCEKLNYVGQINFVIFMVLYQMLIFVFIGSEELGFGKRV